MISSGSTTGASVSTTGVVTSEFVKSVTTSLSLPSSETGSDATVSTAASGTVPSPASLTAYTADVTTLCNTNTAKANIDKNLFMFLWI